jgi:hypothetical protein
MLVVRAGLAWLVILAFAVANGAFREMVLQPRTGAAPAQIASGVILIAGILLLSRLMVPRLRAASRTQLVLVGALWVLLTVSFEAGFGRLIQGRSWGELGDAYTFRGGNLWPLVLFATFAAPLLAGYRNPGR